MWLAGGVGIVTALLTPAPPPEVQALVRDIRIPGQRRAHGIADADMAPAPSQT